MSKFNVYDVLDKFYEALHEKDRKKLVTFFTDEALYDEPDLKVADLKIKTKEAIVRFLVSHMSAYSHFKIRIEKVSVQDNMARVKWTLQGLFKPQGFEKKFSGLDTFSLDDTGKIYRLESTWNPSEHSYGRMKRA